MARAYAKINLGLRVLEKRPDGFHNIETVFHRIDLYDEVELSPAKIINVVSSSPDAPDDESNICYKAARLLQEYVKSDAGVRIALIKKIPVGAGLGGGSSDAATVLRQLPALWGYTVDEDVVSSIALQLGSDVPFFLGTRSALGRCRGEQLEYFDLAVPYAILLCNPNIHVASSWAYQHIRPHTTEQRRSLQDIVVEGMQNPDILTEHLHNDFEEPVFREYPEVSALKELMLQRGSVFASMSGSGSSVYGFFATSDAAMSARSQLDAKGYRTFLTPPHFRATPDQGQQ